MTGRLCKLGNPFILPQNSVMTKILCLFFGLVAGGISVFGQQPFKAGDNIRQWKLQLQPSPGLSLKGFLPSPDTVQALASTSPEWIRNLKPDHMLCLFPDLGRVERMPVRRSSNADPMPNGLRPGRTWSMEIRPAGK